MDKLKVIKATYYDPQMGVESGADVTEELSAEITDSKLFYKGIYNLIFPDPFVGKPKRLKVEIEHSGKKFTKFYNENEKINLPHDLGEVAGSNTSGKGHVAVRMTESARNNVFINSHIHGGVEIAGEGNSFIETTINTLREKKEKHPFWFAFMALGTLIGIITGLMYLAQYFGYLPTSFADSNSPTYATETTATSTVPLTDILSKALTLETVVERQDFLKKYIGSTVVAQGTVTEVSRSGASGFLVDLKVLGQTVTCPQEASEENEKQLPLLKGKSVQIVGRFPFSEIWGHGLGIDECSLTRL